MERLQVSDSAASLGEASYRFPATHTQQAFWYLDRLDRGNPAWNIAVRFELKGHVDAQRLEAAVNAVVERHESLRTTFELSDGEPMQIVHAGAFIPLPLDDLSAMPDGLREVVEEELTVAEGEQSFSLSEGPLLRTRLLKLESEHHILLLTVHHIVSDGWSIGLLSDELAALYAAETTLDALPLQFADYAIWHRQYVEAESAPSIDYWQQQLAGLPACEIPPDFPRPSVKSHTGHILSTLLPEKLASQLSGIAIENGTTFYVLAASALKLLIAHRTGQQDVYLGTQLAGRSRVEFEQLIGIFVNTAVLRTDVSAASTFPELLLSVSRTFDQAVQHGEVPYAQVVAALRTKFDRSRHAVYGINFIFQRDFVKPIEFAGVTMTSLPSKSPGAIYDLNFFMVRRASGWRLSCEYDSKLYLPATVNHMLGQLRGIFEQIASDPGRKLDSFRFEPSPLEEPAAEPPARMFQRGARK